MTELRAISADGTAVTALAEGSGPTILIVHPGGGDATSWGLVSQRLADAYRTVRIQRRIYAPGAALPPDHSMAVEAADILAILDLLDQPVLLVGHSSGGVAALEAALLAPSALAGILVYEPPMPTRKPIWGEAGRRARAALDAGDPAEAMRIHLRDVVGMPAAQVDALFANPGARSMFAAVAAPQITDGEALDRLGLGIERFTKLEVPVTILEGDDSPAHLRERASDLASALPNSRLVTLHGQGHAAHLTGPSVLADAVRDAARSAFQGASSDLG
jgi:pimeloyl-ACP methyl ester carboxylesterase